ncbi:DNA topoisomerase 3 [Oligoflexus sp.]|uniref:DNA topoisomerase 3 n=1 Tax=Oligoflexus sp. TaxID=1971216 RepID=UPI002D80936B|nr:DNA topoisomerase 3 [Oligoflexus sp.]
MKSLLTREGQAFFFTVNGLTTVIITEKPSVARDIAQVLGLTRQGKGFIEGPDYKVAWAYGHLVGLAEPHQMNPAWKSWRLADLPMLPESWPLEIMPDTADQFAVLDMLMNDARTQKIICATDAGREGELIFRYIYDKARCRKPVERLWISSLTPEAIRQGLAQLKPSREFDSLADSAKARSRADWLVGMNLSRAWSLVSGEHYSIGRVQTPTLAMLVEREKAILNFVVEDYAVLQAEFSQDGSFPYSTEFFAAGERKTAPVAKRFKPDDPELPSLLTRLQAQTYVVTSLKEKANRMPPPQFYDLTELQRHANRIFGYSAQRTLDLAQDLYEKYKLITYPRTDSRFITEDLQNKLPEIVETLRPRYADELPANFVWRPLGKRFVDAAQVSDHHAILPTGQRSARLTGDHEKLFDMICRRLLTAYMDDFVTRQTDVIVSAANGPADEGFFTRGRKVVDAGWKVLDFGRTHSGEKELPPALAVDRQQDLQKLQSDLRKTVPPPRHTDASLLTAMETAGANLDDKEMSAVMREHGLGTPATRSGMIETLIKRQYIERDKKAFRVTEKGLNLIELVSDEIKSPELTGHWELKLSQMRRGQGTLEEFTHEIMDFVRDMTRACLDKKPAAPRPRAGATSAAAVESVKVGARPRAGATAQAAVDAVSSPAPQARSVVTRGPVAPTRENLRRILKERFGFPEFRNHQEATCMDLVAGRDVLLVMPTGAGKSLCYQLPGLALGGPTLVISPLIALMDDQVQRLQSIGLRADAIHSGKTRPQSQKICQQYADGELEFLFIAPERLGVTGFVPFLAKHKPTLIAIDEAHCISQWGHDFRYDYRRLAERLTPLQPTVTVAMTATATSRVQRDIIDNLSLKNPALHVHGFRRTNIAIEHIELSRKDRPMAAMGLLKSGALPAIVYTPTRKDAEALALLLGRKFRAAAYHAGMDPRSRQKVQTDFLENQLEVIVATIAFGMGIDKANVRTVVHMAVPSSIEGYYQEIGRAGRDGLDSRAVLFFSYADVKTHEYFHKLNYPELKDLQSIQARIPRGGILRMDLATQVRDDDLEQRLERLFMVEALDEDSTGLITTTGKQGWEKAYEEQKAHRHKQLMETIRYVNEMQQCRMLGLLAHFGDPDARGTPCGICDICSPQSSQSKAVRHWTAQEIGIMKKLVLQLSRESKPVSTGKLYRDYAQTMDLHRRDYEDLLQVLAEAGFMTLESASFVKDGETIEYKTVALNQPADRIVWEELKRTTVRLDRSAGKSSRAPASPRRRQGASSRSSREESPEARDVDRVLLETLKVWRKTESKKRKVPAYRILSDRSLEDLAVQKPCDRSRLLEVHGIGEAKLELYGDSLLHLITRSV